MNGLLGLGLLGWIVSLVVGFVVGGIFFLAMKLQVQYVVERRGPTWLLPVAMYARMVFLAAVLIAVALLVQEYEMGRQVPAMMVAGVAGALIARVLVQRTVGRRRDEPDAEGEDV